MLNNRILTVGFIQAIAPRSGCALWIATAGKRSVTFLATAAAFLIGSNADAATASATVGQRVTLSVTAQGTAPFTYQWYKNGAAVSGGTSSTYTIASATINDAASYSAVVRNASGSTVSDIGALVVNPLPVVVPPPPPPPPVPPAVPTTVTDSGFESVVVGSNTFYAFRYNPVIPNWTFTGNAGISGNNSGFTSSNPASPEGKQVGFIQTQGSATLQMTFSAGSYMISAMTANRANYGGSQTVLVYLDGVQVGRFAGGTPFSLSSTPAFNVTAGVHSIRFAGQSTTDATLFLDQIKIAPATAAALTGIAVASSGFESPDVGANSFTAFRYRPDTVSSTQAWKFQGFSGIAGNNSGFTSKNPNAPEGGQVAFLQMTPSLVSQTIQVPTTGSYKLTVLAAQRANYNQGDQRVEVYLGWTFVGMITPSGGAYQTFTLPFTATAGTHELIFRGLSSSDATVLLDKVAIQPGT